MRSADASIPWVMRLESKLEFAWDGSAVWLSTIRADEVIIGYIGSKAAVFLPYHRN